MLAFPLFFDNEEIEKQRECRVLHTEAKRSDIFVYNAK